MLTIPPTSSYKNSDNTDRGTQYIIIIIELQNTYVRISDIATSMALLVPSETVIMMKHVANNGLKKRSRLEKLAEIITQVGLRPFYHITYALCEVSPESKGFASAEVHESSSLNPP
jgi:hypothetical protein